MNLWAKSLRQLAVIAVALFFFSCEDDTISGYKTNPKFKVNYLELDIPSSVVLLDSIRTSNLGASELSRVLVGSYHDDAFGEVTASAYTEFLFRSIEQVDDGRFISVSKISSSAETYDSVVLRLRFDLYYQGPETETAQSFSVFELSEGLKVDSLGYYFNRSSTNAGSLLGSTSVTVNGKAFDEYREDTGKADTSIYVRVKLDNSEFNDRLWDNALKYRDVPDLDSSLVTYNEFIEKFKGLAIIPDVADKVISFTPTGSSLRVHYHDTEDDSLSLIYSVGSFVSYSRIEADRGATQLSDVANFRTQYEPGNDLRYVQAGTGISTQLDLQPFLDFLDADSNANLIINEAQLVITGVEPQTYSPLTSFSLRIAEGNAPIRFAPSFDDAAYEADSAAFVQQRILYNYYLGVSEGIYTVARTASTSSMDPVSISEDEDNDRYIGYPTFFLQQLHKDNGKKRFRYYTLYPQSHPVGKSLNGIAFNKNNIKLRIYYTRPI
jgi:hypothetical protein